jgi:predicted tellurium resistance membrane protein TerC
MNPHLQQILDNPLGALAIVGNLVIIESLLSVDNAAVLATLVGNPPMELRQLARRYGIIGAYVFRGLCLLFASFLIEFWFLKPLGGLYLLYLAYDHFQPKNGPEAKEHLADNQQSWIYRRTLGLFGPFWATVALIELMDLAFSIGGVHWDPGHAAGGAAVRSADGQIPVSGNGGVCRHWAARVEAAPLPVRALLSSASA